MCVYVYMYICMHAYIYVCMYVCMYLSIYLSNYLSIYLSIYLSMVPGVRTRCDQVHHPTHITRFLQSSYALDGSLFHPSVYFSVTNTTLWPFLFHELKADIHFYMTHASSRPSDISLFFQCPTRFNLCYQRKFLLFKCLFLRRAQHSMVFFLL